MTHYELLLRMHNFTLAYLFMCFARSVKVIKRDKRQKKTNQHNITFYRGIIYHSLGLRNFVKTLEEFCLKPKGIMRS